MVNPKHLSSPLRTVCDEAPSENPVDSYASGATDAGEMHSEVPEVDVEDAGAGPSSEQPLVVVLQALCRGDDPPQLCEYEKLRERNIRERDEAMREAMEEIDESKQEMRDNAPGAKKASSSEEAGGMREREKAKSVLVEEVRSGRNPVSCVEESCPTTFGV